MINKINKINKNNGENFKTIDTKIENINNKFEGNKKEFEEFKAEIKNKIDSVTVNFEGLSNKLDISLRSQDSKNKEYNDSIKNLKNLHTELSKKMILLQKILKINLKFLKAKYRRLPIP